MLACGLCRACSTGHHCPRLPRPHLMAGYVSGGPGVDFIFVSGSAPGDQDSVVKARALVWTGADLSGDLLPRLPVTLKAVGERE